MWLVILKPMSAALPPVPAAAAAGRAAQVRFRRAVTLMLMTVVMPGSAQVAAGNKRVGHNALRAFAAAVLFAMVMVLTLLLCRDQLIIWFTNVWFLSALRFGLILYAVGWAYLLIDAWRIADPLGLQQSQRLAMTALNGVLCLSLSGALLYASQMVAEEKGFIQAVFGHGVASEAADGRYNVLLLGGDAGVDRIGLRPDSMTVASIDQQTGRSVLFSLPRNLANVPFPPGTVMHEQFPHGFTGAGCADDCLLNAVNTWAEDHKSLFPGVDHPGILATTQAIEQVTGLPINYYVMVDLGGFRELVDALGGIQINVRQEVPIGGIGGAITGYIKPGNQTLNGYQTLWYSRSRVWSSDYSRMARQKCVMNAMLHQLEPDDGTHEVRCDRLGRQGHPVDVDPGGRDPHIRRAGAEGAQPAGHDRLVRPAQDQHQRAGLHPDPADGRDGDHQVAGRRHEQGPRSSHQATQGARRQGQLPAELRGQRHVGPHDQLLTVGCRRCRAAR